MARLNINGKDYDVDVDPSTPLLWAIRENVGLTGTKYGCGIAQCGACTVHLDGEMKRPADRTLRPGDVLVFGCGSSISELTEALRPTKPEIAQRIAAEAV